MKKMIVLMAAAMCFVGCYQPQENHEDAALFEQRREAERVRNIEMANVSKCIYIEERLVEDSAVWYGDTIFTR